MEIILDDLTVEIHKFDYHPGTGKDYHLWMDPDDAPGYILEYTAYDCKGNRVDVDLDSELINILT